MDMRNMSTLDQDYENSIEFLPCTHMFHGKCIEPWLRTNPECPICKIPYYISSPEHLEIYLHNKRNREEQERRTAIFYHSLSDRITSQPEVTQNHNENHVENTNINEQPEPRLESMIRSFVDIYMQNDNQYRVGLISVADDGRSIADSITIQLGEFLQNGGFTSSRNEEQLPDLVDIPIQQNNEYLQQPDSLDDELPELEEDTNMPDVSPI